MYKKITTILLNILLLLVYALSFLFVRDNKTWVFGSNLGNIFGDNPKYLYLYINQLEEKEIKAIWITGNKQIKDALANRGLPAYYLYSFKGIFYSLRAGVYIFDHISKDICFWLSGGALKVNLFHGIPLKKIHHDNKFDMVRNPPNFYWKVKGFIRRLQNEQPEHYFLVTSQNVLPHYVSAFNSSIDKALICGYPRNDIFFKDIEAINNESNYLIANDTELFERVMKYKTEGYSIIVYMPTHRHSEKQLFEILDFLELDNYLCVNKAILLVKAHPMSGIKHQLEQVEYKNILNIEANADPYPFLIKSDALITDYSSIYFDYLLTNKPIIFFAYDLEVYIRESRELYYDYNKVTPGLKATTFEELLDSIDKVLNNLDQFIEDRLSLRNYFFDDIDGKSSERLYQTIRSTILPK